ncbi:MAG: DUF4065 domain-containing protein [Firmicutes bacterium]|nr:DUF4065 domain-containing protein [Bacillota bacterium]
MEKKIYCFNCNKDVKPNCKREKNTYTVHNHEVHVEEDVFTCPYCENELINEGLDSSLYNIYNEYLKKYELSFEKLKEIRNSYNLSQELFAKALGWSKRTIVRYENADSLPQKQYLLIYQKISNNKNEFLNILKSNQSSIDNETYFKIYNAVNAELDLKTINVFLYVLKNNFLTKTQIMKNLFSIDFQSKKEANKPITSLKYAHGIYGPIIDNKDAYLSFLIKQNYLEFVSDEEDRILFKPTQKCDVSLFTKEEIAIMNKVLHQLRGKEAKSLTDWSHKFKGWLDTKKGEIIDYKYAKYFDLEKNW